jgi:hypothetical protein
VFCFQVKTRCLVILRIDGRGAAAAAAAPAEAIAIDMPGSEAVAKPPAGAVAQAKRKIIKVWGHAKGQPEALQSQRARGDTPKGMTQMPGHTAWRVCIIQF